MEGKVIQFSGRNLTNVPNVTKLKDFKKSTKNLQNQSTIYKKWEHILELDDLIHYKKMCALAIKIFKKKKRVSKISLRALTSK